MGVIKYLETMTQIIGNGVGAKDWLDNKYAEKNREAQKKSDNTLLPPTDIEKRHVSEAIENITRLPSVLVGIITGKDGYIDISAKQPAKPYIAPFIEEVDAYAACACYTCCMTIRVCMPMSRTGYSGADCCLDLCSLFVGCLAIASCPPATVAGLCGATVGAVKNSCLRGYSLFKHSNERLLSFNSDRMPPPRQTMEIESKHESGVRTIRVAPLSGI